MSTVKIELDIPETLAKYLDVNDPDYKKKNSGTHGLPTNQRR